MADILGLSYERCNEAVMPIAGSKEVRSGVFLQTVLCLTAEMLCSK